MASASAQAPAAQPASPSTSSGRGGSDADEEAPATPLRFVSSEWKAAKALGPPAKRLPILFPRMTLQMMKLPPEQLKQLKETGWLREVAFRTTPDVTKLEIAAYLESLYGMSVERVNTINYLGRRVLRFGPNGRPFTYREDDWKKAYVIFHPPPGLEHLMPSEQAAAEGQEAEEQQQPTLQRIRAAARMPRPAPKHFKWEDRPGGGMRGK